MLGSSLGDLALRRVWNNRTRLTRMSSTSLRRTPFLFLTYAELRSRSPSRFIVLRCLCQPGRLLACVFRVCGRSSKRSSARQPCAPSEGFSGHLHGPSKAAGVGFCAQVPPRLLSLLPCCVHLSFHIGPRAPTLWSAWKLRARYQLGRTQWKA